MLRSAVLVALFVGSAHASVSVTIQNSCSESIALYDNSDTTTMAAGASTTRTLANGYVGMFRNGASDEATLAEFSVDSDGTPWYDLSIIPPGSGTCTSLSACQELTGVTGFNTALQIAPQSNTDSTNCETVTCLADGCDDAYQYPSDDDNTHTCPSGTSFVVTFCPGGSGGSSSSTTSGSSSSESTSSPTTTPTATPEPTTATPEPTTATPEPTTATPEPTTETPTVTPTVTPTATTAAPTATPEPTTETPTVTPTPSTEAPASSNNSTDETGDEAEEGSFTLDETTAPATTAPVSTTSAPVSTTAAPSTTAPASTTATPTSTSASTTMSTGTTTTTDSSEDDSGSDSAETINTQSSDDSSSTVGIVFAAGAAVLGIAAGGFIYTMRQKRKRLEMEAKTPRDLLAMNTPTNVL